MNNDLEYDATPMDKEQFKALEKAFQKQQKDAREAQEAEGRQAMQDLILSRARGEDIWDEAAFDRETEKQRKAFDEYRTQQDAIERRKTESENAQSFVEAYPRFRRTKANAQSVQSYLTERHLPATAQNLQRAYLDLEQVLDLEPEQIAPPKIYSLAELESMPLDSDNEWDDGPVTLRKVAEQQAAQNAKLVAEGDDNW